MTDFSNPHNSILKALKEKSCLKQDVFKQVHIAFHLMRTSAQKLAKELNSKMNELDDRVTIVFTDKGEFQFELKVAGDVLVFQMHTNIFDFDKNHYVKKFSYITQDPMRSFCGLINVYNFLADSFKYSRTNDIGYLVSRLFINNDSHYFMEGKNRNMVMLHENFSNDIFTEEKANLVVEQIVLSCLEFDLYTPPYDTQKEVTVSEINESSTYSKIQTGKRLGFKFQMEDNSNTGSAIK